MNITLDLRLLILCFIFSLLGIILGVKFSSFNYLYIFTTFIAVFIGNKIMTKSIFYKLLITLVSFVFVLLFTNHHILYFFLELCVFSTILVLLYKSLTTKINKFYLKNFNRFCLIYIVVYFLSYFVLSDQLIDSELGRYAGFLGSTNFSSSFVCILLIYVYEYAKTINHNKKNIYFILCILFWGLLINITKSRTLLLILPYWLLQLYYTFEFHTNKLKLMVFVPISILIIISIYLLVNFDLLFMTFRITDDGSYLTRELLYDLLLKRIKDSHYLVPNGFNDAYSFVQSYTKREGYAVHNDFLKYWNDLGGVFFIYLFMVFLIIKKKLKNKNFIFIMVFVLSLALHNILFSMIIWLPLYFLFKLIFIDYNDKKFIT